MTIEVRNGKVLFVYKNYSEAEDAFKRLRHLMPHICSHGGKLNALVVDLEKVPAIGEMQ